MVDLNAMFNVASIAMGFVAAVCFCIGAASNSPKNIALSSATIVGANPGLMRSLSAQRAQYLIGALFLVASFALQVGVVFVPKDVRVALPFVPESPYTKGTYTKGTGVDFFLSHGGATARLTWTRWVVRAEPDTIAATN